MTDSKRSTTKFSQIRRPDTPDRRARVDTLSRALEASERIDATPMIEYPVRVRIIDVNGIPSIRTPDVSRPHIGKEGLAVKIDDDTFAALGISYRIRITLDDGTIIHGDECWWEPIE